MKAILDRAKKICFESVVISVKRFIGILGMSVYN